MQLHNKFEKTFMRKIKRRYLKCPAKSMELGGWMEGWMDGLGGRNGGFKDCLQQSRIACLCATLRVKSPTFRTVLGRPTSLTMQLPSFLVLIDLKLFITPLKIVVLA
jgi:hypothetical protein